MVIRVKNLAKLYSKFRGSVMESGDDPVCLRRMTVSVIGYDGEELQMEHRENDISMDDTRIFSDRMWRRSYLSDQVFDKQLYGLLDSYTHKINHGYMSTFLILLAILMTTHLLLVLSKNMLAEGNVDMVIIDLVLYGMLSILSICGLIVSEKYVKGHPRLLVALSVAAFVLLLLTNILVPILHYTLAEEGEQIAFRPIYTAVLIISCYVFFHITSDVVAILLGALVTAIHIVILVVITYPDGLTLERFGADVLYLICLNGFGIHFRQLMEIIKMRSCLDKWSSIEPTVTLKAEQEQRKKLMLSIIPKHLADKMYQKIYDAYVNKKYTFQEKPYIEEYSNVTILYADIVNYTHMTTTLKSLQLVTTLHDLFSRFDDASKDLNVQRIKFLGDCYYCVAGLPDAEEEEQQRSSITREGHADACVMLGLTMIQKIQDIRNEYNLDINMRIGVHSGSIIGGIIGTTKWQFDIWSNDVYIANRMETTGKAGMVHITKQTKDLLKHHYNITPSDAGSRDLELSKRQIECFLISPELPPCEEEDGEGASNGSAIDITDGIALDPAHLSNHYTPNGTVNGRRDGKIFAQHRRASLIPAPKKISVKMQPRFTANNVSRRTPFMDNNLNAYCKTLAETGNQVQQAVDDMPLSKSDQWLNAKEIHPLLLFFRNFATEMNYIKRPDPVFKYYILSDLLIFMCVVAIQHFAEFGWNFFVGYVSLAFIMFVLLPLSWVYSVHRYHRYAEKTENRILRGVFALSTAMMKKVSVRVLVYLIVCTLCAATVFTEMVQYDCEKGSSKNTLRSYFLGVFYRGNTEEKCVIPWHMTEACALIILINFTFLRIYMWLKVAVAAIITVLYSYFIWTFKDQYKEGTESINHFVDGPVAHIVGIIYLTLTLHFIDRQTDYMHRLDHKWKEQSNEQQEDVQNVHDVNNKLLNNILPLHVALNYTGDNPRKGLYYEDYNGREQVAVMFASMNNYDKEMPDKMLLNYLSGMITAFDQILLEHYDNVVEKIKVANWTYMAATGLDPGRRASFLSETEGRRPREHIVISLLKFAVDIKKQVKIEDMFQGNQLKIGISHGSVTAGIVGAAKPLYDIWGDPVNMASRMESTGIVDRIQVMEETARIIQRHGYSCTFRGRINVKGKKDPVPTYFVDLDSNDNLIKI